MLHDQYRKNLKSDMLLMRNVIYNAGANLMRKRGQREIKLFDDNESLNTKQQADAIREERKELFGSIE